MFTELQNYVQEASQSYLNIDLNERLKELSNKKLTVGDVLAMNIPEFCFIALSGWVIIATALNVLQFVGTLIWDNLTPGQKWLELFAIISSAVTMVVLGLLATEFEKKLDQSFTKLKVEIVDKTAQIAEKDARIAELEKLLGKVNELSS